MTRTTTGTAKIVDFLIGIKSSVCQRCICDAIELLETIVTLELAALGRSGRLGARRAPCAVCRADGVVFRLAR